MVQISTFGSAPLARSVKTRLVPRGDHCGLPLRRPVAALSVSQRIFDVQSLRDRQVAGTVPRSRNGLVGSPRPPDSKTSRSFVGPRRAVDKSLTSTRRLYGVSWRRWDPSG